MEGPFLASDLLCDYASLDVWKGDPDMKSICLAVTALVMSVALPAVAQPKTYDLSMGDKPVKGYVFKHVESQSLKMKMKMVKGGKVMLSTSEAQADSFVALRTILEVEGSDITKEKMEFEKAVHTENGEKTSYAFEGKTVIASGKPGEGNSYAYEDGTALSEEESKAIDKMKGKNEQEDGPSGTDLLAPDKPVKVGESWKPDVVALAMDMLDLASESELVKKKSSAKLTLVKVKPKDGVDIATIKGAFKLWTKRIGEVELKKAVQTRINMTGDMAVDGSIPDGSMSMTMTIKGTAPMVLGPTEEATVTINMTAEFDKKMTTVSKPSPVE
jgi:hypothetical protein